MKSNHWNDSALFLTYHESGGWYDHVRATLINGETYGIMVLTLIIYPFAKKSYADSTIYDVASILKFTKYNYDLSPLSARHAYASNMLNAFDFKQATREASIDNMSSLRPSEQVIEKNMQLTENLIKIYRVYLVIISLILVIEVIL